ncbi:serine hydrolase domain-containing protein [Kitasatospora paranensis]|uniref:Serine hydrolase domain-containing protein n=1 Tax=Kitasatospora paranensis TaxID=258053 RepID=A0ABW2FT87_9ACTN
MSAPESAPPNGADHADPAELVRSAVEAGVVPGAVLLTGRGATDPGRACAFGRTAAGPPGVPVTPDTVYDLASLTKVVATTPAVLRLADEGALRLDDPVRRHLPTFTGSGKGEVTISQLLSHSSGLPPHRDFWRLPGTPADRVAAVLGEGLEHPPGTVVRYSDLGFILLGEIVAAVTAQPLDRAVRALVLDPLRLADTGYLPAPDLRARCAATEAPPGGEPKVGTVHDENAESLGGVAGHAGLFGTAPDLARYLRLGWLAEDSPILSVGVRAEALRCRTSGLDGVRGLGWTLRGDTWDHTRDPWPRSAAGHTGFTGTSLAFDPVTGVWAVLLTNAVHLGRGPRVRELRKAVHAAVAHCPPPSPPVHASGSYSTDSDSVGFSHDSSR